MIEKKKTISRRYLKSRWQHFLSRDKNGTLLIEGVSVEELRKKYGTPAYVLVEAEVRKKMREFKEAFDYPLFKPQYACKVNSNLEVLKIAREEGFDFDASSVGEIILGLLADFEPKQISFTNLYKTQQDILFAASVGVNSITVDSLEEIQKAEEVASRIKRPIPLLIRVNPLIKDGNYTTQTQQYGIPYPYIKKAIMKIVSSEFLQLKGFHFHGSYAYGPNSYLIAAEKLVQMAKFAADQGISIDTIDLGGGFPAEAPRVYRPGKYFTPKELAAKLIPHFNDLIEKSGLKKPILILEPGKSMVANAIIGLFEVISKKKVTKKELLVTNASCYSMFPDILVSHCVYEILPAQDMLSRRNRKYDIVGCTCDCLDVIGKNQIMPRLHVGDMIALMDCGAYSYVMASNFNNLKRPPMISIKPDGTTKMIRRRDRYSEMFAPELDILKSADPQELKKLYNLSRVPLHKVWETSTEKENNR
jgi:diaminopimelate decarboxylase